jgi:hypothetical protein
MNKKQLIIFKCHDKEFHEEVNHDNYGDLPHPFRVIMAAVPNCGKTSLIKNIIVNQSPDFDRIIVWHIDVGTREYSDLDCEVVDELPMIEDIDPKKKNLLIIEDVDTKSLHKSVKSRLNRMFGYCSTHRNLSVILTAQEAFQVPVDLRRTANYLVLWRGTDNSATEMLGKRFGLNKKKIGFLFDTFCKTIHDSLIIDNAGGPKIRKNLFEIIEE